MSQQHILQTPGGREWTQAGGSRRRPAARSNVTPLGQVVTTRYRCPSPAERLTRRVARSPFAQDIRERLPLVPEVIGCVAAAYVFILVVRGIWFAAVLAGVA